MTYANAERLRLGAWTLVALPALFASWLVYRYGIDVPFWDEWTIAPLLRGVDDGTLTVAALFSQHNEHRMLVPRVIQLLAAISLGWDTRMGMWLTQGILLAMMAACVTLWRRSTPRRLASWSVLSFALVSLILYSPAQHQNLFWGFQFCFYIPAACLLASTVVASTRAVALGPALALLAALSTIATFSIFPGLLTWPLAAMSIVLARGRPDRDSRLAWLLWAAACTAIISIYFIGYEHPVRTPSVRSALGDPLSVIAGAAACVGGSLGIGRQPVRFAMITGAMVTAMFLALVAAVWRRRSDTRLVTNAAPWLVMGSFALATATAVAIGRVGYGYVAMLESRYISFTAWLLVGVVMLAATLREHLGTSAAIRAWKVVCLTTVTLSALGFTSHLESVRRTYNERLQSLAIYTFAEAAPRATPLLPPWVDWPSYRQELIQVERSGRRRVRPAAPQWTILEKGDQSCEYGDVEFLNAVGSRIMAGGWAYLPSEARPADAVLATVGRQRQLAVVQAPLIGRADIGDRFDSDDALVTGWTLDAANSLKDETIEFWALNIATRRAYRLCESGGHPR